MPPREGVGTSWTSVLPTGLARLVRGAFALMGLLLAAHLAALVPAVHDAVAGTEYLEVLEDAIYVLAGVTVGVRAVLLQRDRWAWALLSAGLLSYAAGNIVAIGTVTFPSIADALWLPLYPLGYASIVLLLRQKVRRWHASMWLDGLVAALGVSAVAVALVLAPFLRATDGAFLPVAVNLSYPIADLLMLALVVAAFATMGWRPSATWWLLGFGWLAFVFADTVLLVQVAHDSFAVGSWVDNVWLIGVVPMALAAWMRPASETELAAPAGWLLLAVPATFTLIGVGLLVKGSLQDSNSPTSVVVLSGATIVAALVRMSLTFREVRGLAEARHEARTDDLTELGNRRFFLERLDQATDGTGSARCAAVLLIDLDSFKDVNDSYGHQTGDQLLRMIGPRLRAALRDGDTLTRMGGDEFGIVLHGADAARASDVARTMRDRLRDPFVLVGMPLHVEASIGISLFPDHGRTPSMLLQYADVAMYEAKRGQLGYTIFDPARDGGSRHRLETLEELRVALDTDQLVMHYQPKLDLASGDISGVEALVRWTHPTRGLLLPDSFLPIAERAGLMGLVTGQVLDKSLRDLASFRSQNHQLSVAVNLSVSNLQDVDLPHQVELLLAIHGVPPEALVLEITENILMGDAGRSGQVLDRLRAIGVKLSVDDYGTGYSSLAYLQALPVHELKLDRSFVTHMSSDPRAATIVRSTIELSHQLGMVMVAEGVEDAAALQMLREAGCDVAQGYFVARPMAGERLAQWLDDPTRAARLGLVSRR